MEEAKKMIDSADRARARDIYAITGQEWADMRQYHLCIDTGVVGLAGAKEVILS